MSHTPGPWTKTANVTDNRRDAARINGADGAEIAVTVQLQNKRTDKTAAFYEAESNARLIAAAPDLLEVITEALAPFHHYRNDETNPPWVAKARAAIARATGGA